MNNREAGRYDNNIKNHPPACNCKSCVARRLERIDAGKNTRVPFGGGSNPQYRGLSTSDAESKGLLKWDANRGVFLPSPASDTPKQTKTQRLRQNAQPTQSMGLLWVVAGLTILFFGLLIAATVIR